MQKFILLELPSPKKNFVIISQYSDEPHDLPDVDPEALVNHLTSLGVNIEKRSVDSVYELLAFLDMIKESGK